ncbi:hypothetical protein K1719_014184 [Acacia pycnantha]|nr:hypothetical protein K1719_014184 [Acacia pycnantha]
MASPHNVELEAAKFLHKLIQDSKDEPAKLATKLYVILQHMKSSGKEHSMPYQVISRAMETVINQHGLDIEALKSSRLPLTGGAQIGPSQAVGVPKDSRVGLAEHDMSKMEPFGSNRPPVAPSSGTPDYYQGSVAQRSGQSFDQESPSSLDSRSANSLSQDRRDTANWEKQGSQKDGKKAATKRKRGDASSPVEPHVDGPSQLDSRNTVVNARKGKMTKVEPSDGLPVKSGAYGKAHGGMTVAAGAYPLAEPAFSSPMPYGGGLEHDGGSTATLADAHKVAQIGRQNSATESALPRPSGPPRDTGKSPVSSALVSSSTPFREQQLKQLRAQCLVFLAFRNGLPPKKLHLEIALGTTFSREDGSRDQKGKSQSSNEPNNASGMMMPFGGLNNMRPTDKNPSLSSSAGKILEADSFLKGVESPNMMEDKGNLHSDKGEVERQIQERVAAQPFSNPTFQQHDSVSARGSLVNAHLDDVDNNNLQAGRSNQASTVMGLNKPVNPDGINWSGFVTQNDTLKGPLQVSAVQHELPVERRDNIPSHFQHIGNNNGGSGNHNSVSHLPSYSLKEHWRPVPGTDSDPQGVTMLKDVNVMAKHVSMEQEGKDRFASAEMPASPRFTMSEKWIMDQQKKRFLVEQNWVRKQQKTRQKIASCFGKLKENVNSSEDISAKTKSVIELKKLQLVDLQHRLRRDFLNDFFKPITSEMDHLKSIKKHRHGRRVKQLERFEQKMKEERQKRIRERQKEFFSEIEVHKERLDDGFKIKRERWKGFNRYVKEFHKRKERIHREKIDRIQREKINLLKINDVEGYLRMVQDAKSDRVKQLLKETEKYLQKLGSKLQEAKAAAGRSEHDDEAGNGSVFEKNETTLENEDESDQAKHYLESNEKYYMMAHSIKESIADQPYSLRGGKLREYQMNGLRWLVSLYNNHLNGILADEMGLGKTVQVIALICYLMETKNDRGPFLVVVPSSVLPGWESEINFWAPSILKIVYSGPPEERRRLFKERIVHHKFNVLLTTYEYLMNKHDRPKLSKLHWHYIIIDEGHRIKNASCKLNAELKHYQSSHRLLLTGTPLQNNLEELWALLNFLLPNIFNSSEDFSQWFNKPFESNGDSSPDEKALLSEEENLLIINRLHQVLRPFVLRRLKHKVENQLPEKIERLVRCEASAYQKLLMKRVEENLGSIGASKARSVHNSVMELRNICNHPYLSQLHAEEVDNYIPKHYLPPVIRLCGKLEMLDRLLPKLKATDHRVLFFSTMTRLLDVMEEYLTLKQYRYLRLDGHTSGSDRGALIDMFNQPGSPFFIFLLSIRAGGVGVNLQAADTVIIFDTDWNPQVDLQAQARAHRIGQKRDVLVLRFETVQTVEEQVRAAAEHKLGVANQSITAGFFDNNTSAEDRREYLESLLRESKKEEAAPVLDDDALNDLLARSETELDIFEAVDKKRREEEMATWKKLILGQAADSSDLIFPLPPSRLVTDDDLTNFYEAMKIYEVPKDAVVSSGVKRKGGYLGGLDTQHYGRGKRAREVRSYEEQWTEEEFEKLCQVESPESPKVKEEVLETSGPANSSNSIAATSNIEPTAIPPVVPSLPSVESLPVQQTKEITPPAKRGRGRPKRIASDKSPAAAVPLAPPAAIGVDMQLQKGTLSGPLTSSSPRSSEVVGTLTSSSPRSSEVVGTIGPMQHSDTGVAPSSQVAIPLSTAVADKQSTAASVSVPIQARGQGRKTQSGGELPRRRGKKLAVVSSPVPGGSVGPDLKVNKQLEDKAAGSSADQAISRSETITSVATTQLPNIASVSTSLNSGKDHHLGAGISLNPQNKGQSRKSQSGGGTPRRRGKKQDSVLPVIPDTSGHQELHINSSLQVSSGRALSEKAIDVKSLENVQESKDAIQEQGSLNPGDHDLKLSEKSDDFSKLTVTSSNITKAPGSELQSSNVHDSASVAKGCSLQFTSSNIKISDNSGNETVLAPTLPLTEMTKGQAVDGRMHQAVEASKTAPSIIDSPSSSIPNSATMESIGKSSDHMDVKVVSSVPSSISCPPPLGSESSQPCPLPSESVPVKRQGRKTQTRAEPPRRRGKRLTSALSVPSVQADQDPKLSQLSHNSSGDKAASIVNHGGEGQEWTNATQSQQLQTHLPSGTAVQDSKRKERAVNSSQNKQQKSSSARGDSAPGSSDKVAAIGRIQNVNDVARVMKEVFSGTCLAKPKAHDSVGIEDKNNLVVGVTTKIIVEELNNQGCDNKQCSDIPTSGATSLTSPISVDKHELSGEVSKAQNPEDEMNSDMPTSGAMCPTSIVPVNEKQSGTLSDTKAVLNEIMTVNEPEICTGDVSEKERIQICIESSSTQFEAEAQHEASPLNTPQENVGFEIIPTGDGSSLQNSATPSPPEVGSTGCPAIPLKTDNSSNSAVASQVDTFNLDCSATTARSGIAENTSDKLSPNAENPPSPPASCHGDGAGLLVQPEAVGDQSEVIPPSPATTPHSRTMEVSGMSECGEINSEKETEYSLQASAELSLDDSKTSISANIDDNNGREPLIQSLHPASSDSLEPEIKITSEDNSQNVLEPNSKQSSEKPVLADLKPLGCQMDEAAPVSSTTGFTLQETQPLEGHLESLCEEKMDERIYKCEQLQAVVANPTNSDMEIDTIDTERINHSLVEEEIVPKNASSIDMSSVNEEEKLQDHAHEDPIDTAMVSQPSGLEAVHDSVVVLQDDDLPLSTTSSKKTEEEKFNSNSHEDPVERSVMSEAVVNDSVGVSLVGDIVADSASDTANPSSSSLVLEENRTSSEMNLVKGSEHLKESMDERLCNSSVVLEETKVATADTDVQMISSDSHILHEDWNISSSCLMMNKEKLAGSTSGIQPSSVLPLDESNDSKIELSHGNITPAGDVLSGDKTPMNLCLTSSPVLSKEERVACSSDDGSQASTLRVPKYSDTLGDEKEVSRVDVVETVIDTISSQVKDKEQEGVSFGNNSVVRSVPHEGMDGSKVDQSNNDVTLKAGDILPENSGLEINIMPSLKEVKDVEICDQKEASKSLNVDPKRYAFKTMDALSSSLVTDEDKIAASSDQVPLCGVLVPEESRDISTIDESYEEAPEGSITTTLPQQKSDYSEAEMSNEMETGQVPGVDPEKHAPQNLNMSSLGMVQDKTDVPYHKGLLSNPLAEGELKNCLDGGKGQRHAAEGSITKPSQVLQSGLCDSEMGDQLESSQVAGTNPERLALRNVDVPSPSSVVEESKIVVSSDKSHLSSSLATGESEDSLIQEENCGKAIVGVMMNPLLPQEPQNAGLEMADKPEKLELSNADVLPVEIEESKKNVSNDKEPPCSSVAVVEPKGCLTGEKNRRDATADLVRNPLPPLELCNSGAGMGNEMELTHLAENESEKLELRNMEVPSSSMEIDESKVDVSNDKEPPSSSQTPRESESFLTEESCRDAAMAPGADPLRAPEADVPSSSMEIDENKVDVSNDKEPPRSSLTPREAESFLTGEESCRDATMAPSTDPLPALETDVPPSSMGTEDLDDKDPPCNSVTPRESESLFTGEESCRDATMAPSTDPLPAPETDVPSSPMGTEDVDVSCEGGLTRGEMCGDATMALNKDPLPPQESDNSEAEIGEKRNESLVGGTPVDGDTLRRKALTLTLSTGEEGKASEAWLEKGPVGTSEVQYESESWRSVMKDSTDIIESCAAEMENAAETPCPSASGEKDWSLSEKGIDGCTVGMEVSKGSEADIGKDFTNGCSDVLAAESMDRGSPPQPSAAEGNHVESSESDEVINNNKDTLASASAYRVLPPCSAAEDNQVNSDADVTNNADHLMLENASAESKEDTTDVKDVPEGSSDMLATASVDRASPPSSSATEGYQVGSSETDVANRANDGKQENVSEDMNQPCSSAAVGETKEKLSEKDLPAGADVQQESEEHTVTEDGRDTAVQDLEIVNTEVPENTTPSSHPSPAAEGDNDAQSPAAEGDSNAESSSHPSPAAGGDSNAQSSLNPSPAAEGDNNAQSLP